VRQRSTSTSPDRTVAIDGILQYGQFTETSIPVYHGAVNPLKVIVAWGAFALFHSVTVSEPYERWARSVMGEERFRAHHRLLFTLYSAIATAVALLYVRSLPDLPLYRIDGWIRLLFHGVQILGASLLLWTPWDLKEFVGLRQWERHRKGDGDVEGRNEGLFTGKGYALVRHPLYLGCSLLLAFHPDQTRNSAATAAAAIAYFYIGTFFEERRMERKFGEAYREYRRRVPRFLPLPRP
jgi:protein-S-isoprenylcysteine O-methyltransferase Ste14